MKTLVFFFVALALGSANPVGPTTTEPSLDNRLKTAIDNNVLWLLNSIRNGSVEGPDLARAVLALFLAEPGFFSPGHTIGQELRDQINTALPEIIRQAPLPEGESRSMRLWFQRFSTENHAENMNIRPLVTPSNIPSEELALYVQALLVSCVDPRNFFDYDMTHELWQSVLRHHSKGGHCSFPSSAMLALCNARATASEDVDYFVMDVMGPGSRASFRLTDDEYFLTMTFGCLESHYPYPRDVPKVIRIRQPFISRSGYSNSTSNLTAEDIQELMKPDGNTTSLSAIAAAMQILMYNHHLRVSDLPWAVDFFLNSQDGDGSWGQSAENSLFVLPALLNKSFLNITSEHCPERSVNEWLRVQNKFAITILDDKLIAQAYFSIESFATLYSIVTGFYEESPGSVTYHNGTDGKPYLHSLFGRGNNTETGYFWYTYEQTKWPKERLTLLTQSHADIKFKPNHRYILWYTQKSEEEAINYQI